MGLEKFSLASGDVLCPSCVDAMTVLEMQLAQLRGTGFRFGVQGG